MTFVRIVITKSKVRRYLVLLAGWHNRDWAKRRLPRPEEMQMFRAHGVRIPLSFRRMLKEQQS